MGFALITILFGLTYGLTVPRHITGYGDAEELVSAAVLGGVAHPPGYPVLVTLLKGVFAMFPYEPVIVANFFNAFLQSLALAFLYLAVFRLLIRNSPANQLFPKAVLSALAVVITGISLLMWLTATRIEVIAFTSLLISLCCLSIVSWINSCRLKQAHSVPLIMTTAAVYGFTLGHMQTAILLFPGILFTLITHSQYLGSSLFQKIKIIMIASFIGFATFALPQGILYLQNESGADVSWYFPQTLSGVVRHVMRQDYQGNFFDENATRQAYWAGLPNHFLPMIPTYLGYVGLHFSWVILIVLLIAFGGLIIKKQLSKIIFFVFFVCAGVFLAAYMGEPDLNNPAVDDQMIIGVGHRQYVLGYVFIPFLIAFGLENILSILHKIFRAKNLALGLIVLGASLLIYTQFQRNLGVIAIANTPHIETYALSMLETAKENGVIICSADVACFPLSYLHEVRHIRPDVAILYKSSKMQVNFLKKHPEYYDLPYIDNPDYVTNLIAWNVGSRPVYLTNPTDFYITYMGLNGDPFYLVPQGYLFEVVSSRPKTPPIAQIFPLTYQVLTIPADNPDVYTAGLRGYFSSIHTLAGTIYLNWGNKTEAQNLFELSMSLTPEFSLSQEWLMLIPRYQAADMYENKPVISYESLLKDSQIQLKNGNLEGAYSLARKAMYLKPTADIPHLLIADILKKGNYFPEALQEVNIVLKFHPNNKAAAILKAALSP